VSAHDANDSLTIDRYYSPDNEEMPFDPRNPEVKREKVILEFKNAPMFLILWSTLLRDQY
jgi:hypothetical protein